MGVITEGTAGRELSRSFQRLFTQRNVKLVRADTGIARHLEYNARQIERAVRKVQTKEWGWVGYSQGCANNWKAEIALMTGTPEQRKLLDGLVCRNQLYSAANGTPHILCLEWKISQTVADIEETFKQFQLSLSANMTRFGLEVVGWMVANPAFQAASTGYNTLHPLALVRRLWRDAHCKRGIPTNSMRNVVSEWNIPDVCLQLSNSLSRQAVRLPRSGPVVRKSEAEMLAGTMERSGGGEYNHPGGFVAVKSVSGMTNGAGKNSSAKNDDSRARTGANEDRLRRKNPSLLHHRWSTTYQPTKLFVQGDHDTQVTGAECDGWPYYTRNANALMLKQHSIANMVQHGSHWSPLSELETGAVTTNSDRQRRVFDGPKDKHLFPWVLNNARFGIISRLD